MKVSIFSLTALLAILFFATFCSVTVRTAVLSQSDLLLETDRSIYRLGENITTTLTYLGNETVYWMGRDLPWDIFTYPDEECVFAPWICFCAFPILAGENVTYTWNQSDQFTIGSVEIGTYVVRDNQGWGLSVFFKIVDADIVVPYDYSTIQQAINNANEGDSIHVSAGTYYEKVVVNKTVSIVGEDVNSTIIEGDGTGTVMNITQNNVDVAGLTISGSGSTPNIDAGIYLDNVGYCIISENRFLDNEYGVSLRGSHHNTISENLAMESYFFGIHLEYSSNNNTLFKNVLDDNRGGINIHFWSHFNTISQNRIRNGTYGISLNNADSNRISQNFMSHLELGICLQTGTDFNLILENNVNDCSIGVELREASDNRFYHNNFMNPQQVQITNYGYVNFWDNGHEGNYWSNYNGTDLNGNGIGDTELPWEGVDSYPLKSPYVKGDVNHDAIVDIFDAILLANAFGSNSGSPDWNPHCDLNEDGFVDIFDAIILALQFGEEWGYPWI